MLLSFNETLSKYVEFFNPIIAKFGTNINMCF